MKESRAFGPVLDTDTDTTTDRVTGGKKIFRPREREAAGPCRARLLRNQRPWRENAIYRSVQLAGETKDSLRIFLVELSSGRRIFAAIVSET